jgi:3-hydroxybutyryl-CoA dehydrogenase
MIGATDDTQEDKWGLPGTDRIGIIGSGTMGAGIALSALYAGFPVTLQDVSGESLDSARAYIEKYLHRKGLEDNRQLLLTTSDLKAMSDVDVIIEAAPEDLDLKRAIFSEIDKITLPAAVLATNTSTLSVSAIAASVRDSGRVAGLHFFNPAPVLPLVEVIKTATSSRETISRLMSLSKALGKTPVVTRDVPGFIVNRAARPFYGEPLRMLAEGVASVEDLDGLIVEGAGFRMGPFQLMDLIGIDVNLAAMESMFRQTFGEPRYRPHWIQSRMVAAGHLGRKTGRGFYDYGGEKEPTRGRDSFIDEPSGGTIWVSPGNWTPGLTELCEQAGFQLSSPGFSPDPKVVVLTAGRDESLSYQLEHFEKAVPADTLILAQCADITLSEIAAAAAVPERIIGFDGLFISEGSAITLTKSAQTNERIQQAAVSFFRAINLSPVWVSDTPGLVLPRLVAALVNEASFAVLENVADPETIDLAMRLGVNYPNGPLEWGRKIGYRKVVAVLDHLRAEYGEERHRASSLLRKWAR